MLVLLLLVWLVVSVAGGVACAIDGYWAGLILSPILTAAGLAVVGIVIAVCGKIMVRVLMWVDDGDSV